MEDEQNMENEIMNEAEQDFELPKKRRKKKGKKGIIIVIVVIVLVLVSLIGSAIKNISAGVQEQMEAMAGGEDDIYIVERQDVQQEIATSGTVVGVETDAYTSPVTAKVEDIFVEVGQSVQKGDVLLSYDTSELGDNLEKVKLQAQSERAAGNEGFEQAAEAASKASEAKKNAKSIKSDTKDVKENIEKTTDKVDSYSEKIAELEAAVAKDEQAAEMAKAEKKEAEKAAKEIYYNEEGEVIPTPAKVTQALTDAENELAAANSRLAADKAELQKYKDLYKAANKKLGKQNEKLQDLQADLAEQEGIVSANKDVKVSESTKAQVSAANELSNMNINSAEDSYHSAEAGITADKNGIIASIEIYKGALASEAQTLLTIIDGDRIGVEFAIAKDDIGSVTPGQKARVVISGNEYEGTVDFISRVASTDMQASSSQTGGSVKGRILLNEPDENVYIGISAKAYIFIGKSENALAIPYEALCSDVDGDYVYIVNAEGLLERREVKLGIYSDEYYEVLEGIAEEDKVVRNVTSDMKPGDVYMGSGTGNGDVPVMEIGG
ncbi:MAG: HlyD family efflux transporter periplasmic adaptor subunit [Clostridium sp.]|nr:HlyD family efflux transporter periplasmic adaptor subunit [Clostridium sp.]